MTALVIQPLSAEQLPDLPVEDIHRAANFAKLDKAESTRAAYRSDFAIFRSWCASRSVCALPATPEIVAGFLVLLRHKSPRRERFRVGAAQQGHRDNALMIAT